MKKFIRYTIQFHRFFGLLLAINFFLLSITGAILLWRDELEGKITGARANQTREAGAQILQKIETRLKESHPDKKMLALFKDDEGLIEARLTSPDSYVFRGAEKIKFYPDGERVPSKASEKRGQGLFDTVLELHRDLLLGGTGKLLVGLLGLFLLMTIIMGIFIAPTFTIKRNVTNLRMKLGKFHRKVGVGVLAWALIITLTGVLLSFDSYIIGYFLKTNFNQDVSVYQDQSHPRDYVSASRVIKGLNEKEPDFQYNFISYPDNEFSLAGKFAVLLENEREKKIAIVSGSDAGVERIRELPWYLQLIVLSEPLHFGNYGGIPLKLGWMLMTVLVGLIPLTGGLIYFHRKRWIDLENFHRREFNFPFRGANLPTSALILFPTILVLGAYYSGDTLKYVFGGGFLLYGFYLGLKATATMGRENDV